MESEPDLREALISMVAQAREALVSGEFDKSRVAIAGLATWAHEVATLDAVPIFAPNPSAALLDVAAERRRQIEAEGWTPEHDDGHSDGALAMAAACYACPDPRIEVFPNGQQSPEGWPWSAYWWKPKDRRSNLVRAAALLLAEIERLDRAKS